MKVSFDEFFQNNKGRIHYQIRRLGISGDLYEELYAEGVIALWEAYKTFDESKGNIGTYINYKIRFRLIDVIRKITREESNKEEYIQEKITELDDGNRYGLSKLPLVKYTELPLSNEPFWEEVRKHLSDRQWKWVKYFIIADLSLQEIAEIENTTVSAVKSWGREVRRKLRQEKVLKKLMELV